MFGALAGALAGLVALTALAAPAGAQTDTTDPTVTSIVRHNPATSPTDADTVTWRVTFSEPVQNVDGSDFTDVSEFHATPHALSVSAVSSEVYDVTASGGGLAGANGLIRLFFRSTQNIEDLAGNALTNTAVTGTVEDYVLDNVGPTVTITGVPATSTAPSFTATFTFSEAVTGFVVDDITLGNATASEFTATTTAPAGSVYTGLITPTTNGALTTVEVMADVAQDAAGNGNKAGSWANTYVPISIAAVHEKASYQTADVEFRVTRPAATAAPIKVTLSIAQTASYLSDTSPTVTIAANETSAVGKYRSTYGGTTSGTVIATVVAGAGYAPAAAPANTATVAFVATGGKIFSIGLSAASYTAQEGEPLNVQVVLRTVAGAPAPRKEYSIGFETKEGTAESTTTEAANDYIHRSIRVVVAPSAWAAEGTAFKASPTIPIQILEDEVYEGDEYMRVALSRWSGTPPFDKDCDHQNSEGTVDCWESSVTVRDEDTLGISSVAVSSTPASGGIYALGEKIEFTASLNANVTVTGTPRFAFILVTATKQAAYTSGSRPTKLVFSYTVVEGDGDTDGIAWTANALALNGGTIRFTPSRPADAVDAPLTHAAAAAQSGHRVEAAEPTAPRRVSAETPAGIAGYMKVTWLVPSIVPAAADVYQVLLEPVSGRFPDGSPTRTHLTARADGKNATSLEIPGLPRRQGISSDGAGGNPRHRRKRG